MSSKQCVGVLYTSYGMPEYIEKSLAGWVRAKREQVGGNEYVISAVSVQFAEYRGQKRDDISPKILAEYNKRGDIDALTIAPEHITETVARNLALQSLLDLNCDIVVLADGDEFPTVEQIEKIFNFVHLDKFTSWFGISYRNFVFTEKHFLTLPFVPPRIFRVKTNGYELRDFYHDNDPMYMGTVVENNSFKQKIISYKELPSKTIPQNLVWVNHFSWLSNEKSKLKVEYQKARGWQCSYEWDYINNKLIFNESYYRNLGQPLPEIQEKIT